MRTGPDSKLIFECRHRRGVNRSIRSPRPGSSSRSEGSAPGVERVARASRDLDRLHSWPHPGGKVVREGHGQVLLAEAVRNCAPLVSVRRQRADIRPAELEGVPSHPHRDNRGILRRDGEHCEEIVLEACRRYIPGRRCPEANLCGHGDHVLSSRCSEIDDEAVLSARLQESLELSTTLPHCGVIVNIMLSVSVRLDLLAV